MPDLAAVRVQGFAIAAGDRDAALSSASVPVQAPGGEVVAALSISGPGSRLTTERIEGLIPLMRAAAAEIRSQIGGRAGGPTEGVSRGATGSHGHRCNTAY